MSIRGCDIRGAQRDRRRDFGDGIFAVEADLVLWHNVFRGNTGSGLALAQTTARLEANDFLGNGRAGVLLFDRSDATLVQNLFAGNAAAGLEVVERSKATLRDNRFGETPGVAIDAACAESARRGSARLAGGNTFGAGVAPPQACD